MAQPYKSASGRYYIRRKVPVELRAALGMREYKRSLGTTNAAEAKARFAEHLARSEAAFAAARAQVSGHDAIKPGDAERLATQWYQAEQERLWRTGDFVGMLAEGHSIAIEGPHGYEERTTYTTLRRFIEQGGDADWQGVVHPIIEQTLRKHAVPMPARETVPYSRLLAAFGEQVERLSQWALDCYEGEPHSESASRSTSAVINAGVALPRSRHPGKRHTLRELFAAYAQDKTLTDGDTRATRRSVAAYRSIVEGFIELHGELTVTDVSRGVVAQYRASLARLPTRGEGTRNMTAPQLIEKANREGLPTLAPASIRNRLRALSAVLSCGVRLGWIDENPVIASGAGRQAAKAATRHAGAGKRNHYSTDELRAIFTSPIYSGGWTSPKADFGAAWHWLPLLLYYTGARREELAQLKVADVLHDDAVGWYLSILAVDDAADDGRGVKTLGSRRFIPLHADLIKRGFVEYVRSVPTAGMLFPKLRPDPAGYYGSNFGRRWKLYLRDVAKLTSPASPMHGFRHTFKTLCREVGIPEDVHDAITGHVGEGSVARGYGEMPLRRMAEEMRRFPRVSIPELASPSPAIDPLAGIAEAMRGLAS